MHKRSTSVIYHKFYRNLGSSNADNEKFCTVILTILWVRVQSLQLKSRRFESMCVLVSFLFFSLL